MSTRQTMLYPWRAPPGMFDETTRPAESGTDDGEYLERGPVAIGPESDALVISHQVEQKVAQRDLVTLERAGARNKFGDRLIAAARNDDGSPEYDRLGRIVGVRIRIDDHEGTHYAMRGGGRSSARGNRRVEAIVVEATVDRDGLTSVIELPTDVAFENEFDNMPNSSGVVVTMDSDIEMAELQKLLARAVFYCGYDMHDDYIERRKTEFEQDALRVTARLLTSPAAATETILRDAVDRYVRHLIPEDHAAEIRIEGPRSVEVAVTRMPGSGRRT